MAFKAGSLDDYVDVAERIALFREQYPDGSLQPADMSKPYEIVQVEGATFIVYVAAAFRSQDDQRPGVGAAWEPVPGKTNFTRNSELMNAETSAWGRAIIAVLAADSRKGVASHQEVRNRQAEREDDPRNKDGSKPRRGVSDEQFEAEGRMTRQQSREHGALSKDDTSGKATRRRGQADDDPWENDRLANRTQLATIGKLFDQAEWPDMEDRLRAASALVEREVTSPFELTPAEADTLIGALELVCQDKDPATRLADLVAGVREQEGGQP